jgi:hypothetical protein
VNKCVLERARRKRERKKDRWTGKQREREREKDRCTGKQAERISE